MHKHDPVGIRSDFYQKEYYDSKEIEKASEFYFERDKEAFLFRRYWLKRLIAGYLKTDISRVKIKLARYEKPVLDNGGQSLKFNISHSNCFTLYAFSFKKDIGVDIEYCKDDKDFIKIASNFFSKDEYKLLSEVETHRLEIFYNIWTSKEAFLKYKGIGLYQKPSTFSIFSLKEKFLSFKLIGQDHKTFLASVCTGNRKPVLEHFSVQNIFNS